MSKTKKSFYNILASLLEVVISQLITLIVSRKVLSTYGSDINGVNAVFSNTLVWFMLLEGGFTFASSVALFKAFAKNDVNKANRILSATKKALNKIGLLVGLGGVSLAFIAPLFIKTTLSYNLLFWMFLLMAFGTFVGLSYTRKYALMFSVKQEEYFRIYISVIVAIITNTIVYFIATSGFTYIWVRVVFAFGVVLSGLLISYVVKKRYPFISYKEKSDMEAIKGTKDMIFNKFASLSKSTIPLIYISAVIGATFASVYSVYMIIFGFITKLSMMVANAVQNGFGQLVAEKNAAEVYIKFKIFEFAVIFFSLTLITITTPVTMQFIKFYTKNVHDVNYINWVYLFLFVGITIVPILHNPSGIIMLMSGAFEKSKKFQINTLIILIIGIVTGGILAKITGILCAIFLSSLVLAVQEISYTRKYYFKKDLSDFFKTLLILGLTSIFLIVPEIYFIPKELKFVDIVIYASGLTLINFAVMFGVAYLFFNEIFNDLLFLVKSIIKRQ